MKKPVACLKISFVTILLLTIPMFVQAQGTNEKLEISSFEKEGICFNYEAGLISSGRDGGAMAASDLTEDEFWTLTESEKEEAYRAFYQNFSSIQCEEGGVIPSPFFYGVLKAPTNEELLTEVDNFEKFIDSEEILSFLNRKTESWNAQTVLDVIRDHIRFTTHEDFKSDYQKLCRRLIEVGAETSDGKSGEGLCN